MSKLTKMMVARSAGDTQAKRQIGFDMRSVDEKRGGGYAGEESGSNMRMGGYDGGARYERGESMRMGGYDSPESVRRSPRTGRFVRSEMSGGYGAEMKSGSRMSADKQEKWRGGNEYSRYDEHGRPVEGSSRSSRYREYEEDDEDEDMEFSEKIADEWTKSMKNEDGSKGPHWSKEQTRAVMVQHGIVCDPLEFYAQLAKAWLDDKDAVEDKAAAYYAYVVKHDGKMKKAYQSKVRTVGGSDFLEAVNGKDSAKAWEIMDELMETLYSLGHTRVYDSVMRKMEEL